MRGSFPVPHRPLEAPSRASSQERVVFTPLGAWLLEAREEGMVSVRFLGDRVLGARQAPVPGTAGERECSGAGGHLDRAADWICALLAGRDPGVPQVPLRPAGTAYQRRVWEVLAGIPWGRTLSYGTVALRAGGSPRSVGGACGANPLPLLIPCHRVLGAGGCLGGFSSGLPLKSRLLALEGCLPQPGRAVRS